MHDIIIVGMGISGITAAIYAKRANMDVLLIDKGMPGGLLNKIDKISNYPGLIDIKGEDFANLLEKQVKMLDIPYVLEEVKGFELDGDVKKVITSKKTYEAKKVILAMGRRPKYLGLSEEENLIGRGLSTCAVCDAYFYKDRDVAVVGTGDSALSEALYLANIVNHIYLINRREGFRGSKSLVDKVKNNEKIEIIYNANIKHMNKNDNKLSSIALDNGMDIPVCGVFLYVGYAPATDIVPKKILDDNGYIKVNEVYESSINGVYAIGDVVKKSAYQLITAAADGAKVILNLKK